MRASAATDLWLQLLPDLNEAQRRWLAAAKAIEWGWGGLKRAQEATGLSAPTIIKGMREVRGRRPLDSRRVRRPGGGRKRREVLEPGPPAPPARLAGAPTAR